MVNKKTSSNSKLIREINKLKKEIYTYAKKSDKLSKTRENNMALFNKVSGLLYQKKDYINTRTFNSLNKSIVNAKERKLTQLSYILENIQLLGNVKFSMYKIKDIKLKIDDAIEQNKIQVQHKNAFDGSVSDIVVSYNAESLESFFVHTKKTITDYLTQRLATKGNIKCNFILESIFSKPMINFIDDGVHEQNIPESLPFYMATEQFIINNNLDIGNVFDALLNDFKNRIEKIKHSSSGWVFTNTVSIETKTAKYKALRASSYIELPQWIAGKKCCVNVKNEDNECFKWAVLSCLFTAEANQDKLFKVNQYRKFEDRLNWSNIKFPTKIDDIKKFELNNPSVAVNVFVVDSESKQKGENRICPYYSSKLYKDRTIINLLLIEDDKNNHYVWIKNFNRLMGHDNHHKVYYCTQCLQKYSTMEKLEEHKISCSNQDTTKVVMPKEGSITKFKNYGKMLKVPFVWYADFESYLVPIEGPTNDNNLSSTTMFQKHEPASFCLYRVCVDGSYNKMYMYNPNSIDIIQDFLTTLKESVDESYWILKNKKDMHLSKEEEKSYNNCDDCHICKQIIDDDNNHKVRDHDHITGIYRGPAHKNCNLQYRFNFKFPVYFHNLKGYDSHHIIKTIGSIIKGNEKATLGCIPCNNEKYLSFNWDNINFVDSMQFMASSLDELSSNLNIEDKKHVKNHFSHLSDEQFDLITSKGVFPYDWFDSADKMNEISLPSKDSFYSKLYECDIKDNEYSRALKVWKKLKCDTFRDYHDLYLKTDVLLLADVFENFRDVCFKNYELDASHYLTAPGLAWDASLKMTTIELELITDYDKYLFIEKGLRGGNSMIGHRYAKANNKYLPNYDAKKLSEYIIYLDANNLYGWAMMLKLPYKGFKWIDYENIDFAKIDADGDIGYIIECDLEYPKELHDLHNNYPLAPEKITVTNDMLSPFSLELKDRLQIKDDSTSKLICTLSTKKNYVLHIKNLQLYLSLGMKITKVHKVMSFEQKAWLKPYIEYNTNMRKKAKNNFEKDFYKLMNNSVFGKTMENVRNRIRFELVHTQSK